MPARTIRCEPCGKLEHRSEIVAIRKALKSSRLRGYPLRVYRCPHGNGWHLTKRVDMAA